MRTHTDQYPEHPEVTQQFGNITIEADSTRYTKGLRSHTFTDPQYAPKVNPEGPSLT